MFNASWIPPNSQTMKLSTNKHSNNILGNYPKLPQIPRRNQFLTSEKPQFRIQQQHHPQNNFLTFKEIFEIDQKNKFLIKQLINALNEDLKYQELKQSQFSNQSQQDYGQQQKQHRIRYSSYDYNPQSDRSFESQEQVQRLGKQPLNQKIASRKEKVSKLMNVHEENLRDSVYEYNQNQINEGLNSDKKQMKISQKISEYPEKINQDLNYMYEKQKKYNLFKIVSFAVFAALCLSKKYRRLQKKQQLLRNQIDQNYQDFLQCIEKFSKRQVVTQEKQYYEYVAEKVMHCLKDQTFIEETLKIQNQSKEYSSDLRKLNVFKFTTLLFKNVEFYTRQNTISDFIKSLLNISLYQVTAVPISKFVGQRCHFFNDDRLKIPQDQQVLIALEYYFFCNLIPSLLDILTELQQDQNTAKYKIKTNPFHLNECHFYICVIATLIQQKIVQSFSQLRKIKNPNGNLVQKTLKTTEQQNLVIKAQISISTQMDDDSEENEIVKGLISQELIIALEEEKQQWKKFINQTFQQIIKNFQTLLKN